jgi:excisionase family DNA binding protein
MPDLQTTIEHDADGAFRVEEFCRRFGVGRTTVYEEINAGRLVAKKRGTRVLIERSEARRWFSNLPKVRAAEAAA